MGMLAWMVTRLPLSWIKRVSRMQFLGPRCHRAINRLADVFRSGDQTIASGVGKGLRFNAAGTCAGYVLGTNDPEVQKALAGLVRPGSVFYDIGANVGFLSTLAARLAGPEGRVVAFEPVPENVKWLTHNLNINGFVNSQTHTVALGDRDGTAGFLVLDESGLGKLSDYGKSHDPVRGNIEVPIRRLDGFRAEAKLPPPNVIKIDVEGAEVEVLRGATATIAEARPLLFIEMHGTNQPLVEALESIHYRGRVLGPKPSIQDAYWLSMVLAAHEDDAEGLVRIEEIGRSARSEK
jgi:FkbM family methyltransferase